MNQSVNTLSGTGLSDSFGNFDVDVLEISSVLNFLSGSCKINDDIRVFNESVDELLISQVSFPTDPSFV